MGLLWKKMDTNARKEGRWVGGKWPLAFLPPRLGFNSCFLFLVHNIIVHHIRAGLHYRYGGEGLRSVKNAWPNMVI